MLSSSTVLLAQCFEETYFLSLINCCNKMNISGPDLFSLFFKCRKIHSQNNNKHKNKLVFFGIGHIFGIENGTKLPIWHHKIQTSYDTIV